MRGKSLSSIWARAPKPVVVLAAVVVVALIGWGAGFRPVADAATAGQAAATAVPTQTIPLVRTAQAVDGQDGSTLVYPGEVKAASQVSVLPKGSGRIQKLLVDAGSRVKQGDPIAELDADALRVQLNQAKASLAAAKSKYTGMQTGSRSEQIAQAQAQVDSARASLQKAQAAQETVKLGATKAELAAASSAVDQAKLSIKKYQADLDELKAGPKDYEIWDAQKAVETARATLDSANDKVDTWNDGTDAEKVATGLSSATHAQANRQAAQTGLDAAVAKLNYLRGKPYPNEIQSAETALYTALANFESAKARLEQLQRGPTAQDLRQAESSVQAAEAAVVQAEQAHSLALNPYTQSDLGQASAAVQQAQASVEMAEINLRESVVKSPIDGMVAERLQSLGALVGPSTPIVTVVSPEMDAVVSVEEAKVWFVSEGQKAEVLVPAYSGTAFQAKISTIAPVADSKNRTFVVKARPEDPERKLRPGMFVQVKITPPVAAKTALVPKDAVATREGKSMVFVLKGDTVQGRVVTAGPVQNGTVGVTAGLDAGEEVVVSPPAGLKDGDKVRKG